MSIQIFQRDTRMCTATGSVEADLMNYPDDLLSDSKHCMAGHMQFV